MLPSILKITSQLMLLTLLFSTSTRANAAPRKIVYSVAIPPMGWLVKHLIKDANAEVYIALSEGQHPHSFSPSPQQAKNWSRADIHFSMDLPFENIWLKKLSAQNKKLRIIPLAGKTRSHDHDHGHGHDHDPHSWLDPMWMSHSLNEINKTLLTTQPPPLRSRIIQQAAVMRQKLQKLNADLRGIFKGKEGQEFWVHHAAWGHFAKRYNLKQIAIESHGKEPSPKHLAKLIKNGRAAKVKMIFAQKGEPTTQSEFIAKQLGATLIILDPLAEDYLINMKAMATSLAKGLIKQ